MPETPKHPETHSRSRRWADRARLRTLLRNETVGGLFVIAAAAIALIWANVPGDAYETLRTTQIGPDTLPFGPWDLHLGLTAAEWAADLLLALFFLVAGVEVKREFVDGELREPRRAIVPIAATVGGVIVPAALFLAMTASDAAARSGWAIPTATDIAFALAVLAIVGPHLPLALRAFLLTLAVLDDLIAITIIAVGFSDDLKLGWLAAALIPLVLFAVVARRARRWWWLLPILAIVTWLFVHESGVHATVAGVALGLSLPASRRLIGRVREPASVGSVIGDALQPLSAGIALPVFAFFAAGISVSGSGGFSGLATDRVVGAVIVALVAGKAIGIAGGAWVATRLTRTPLDGAMRWPEVIGLAFISGIGFTVSLLMSELAFGDGSPLTDHARIGVLVGSLIAAAIGAVILRTRNRHHRDRIASS